MASQAVVPQMTDQQLQEHAFRVLARELGLGGLARFIRMNFAGRGDYTRDRNKWLAEVTVEDIARELGVSVEGVPPSA